MSAARPMNSARAFERLRGNVDQGERKRNRRRLSRGNMIPEGGDARGRANGGNHEIVEEVGRQQAEARRQAAEIARGAASSEQETAEQQRHVMEESRVSAETLRQIEETGRAAAEQRREVGELRRD